jgi:hypothetical protein
MAKIWRPSKTLIKSPIRNATNPAKGLPLRLPMEVAQNTENKAPPMITIQPNSPFI